MADKNDKSYAEYNSLCNQKRRKEQELENARTKNRLIDAKIQRLQTAYKSIKIEYDSFFRAKQDQKRALTSKRRWKGALKGAYDAKVEELKTANDAYYKEINRNIMDEINNKINELRKQKYSDSFIGNLQKGISDLGTKIKNWFN